jgi:hypothetical protein
MPLRDSSRRLRGVLAILLGTLCVLLCAPAARAVGPPTLGATWASAVDASSVLLHTEVNPNGLVTAYHFDYLTVGRYEANVAQGEDPFAGAAKVPAGLDPTAGSGATLLPVSKSLTGVSAETAYRYRAVAKSSAGTVTGEARLFTTQGNGTGSTLLDGRAWEMVSPVDKNGGSIAAPEALAGGGVLQAASGGGVVTYGSSASFGSGAQGSPIASQYIARRTAGGWSTENITTAMLSGSYGVGPVGVPYRLFSTDLARGLLLNGRHCRGGGEGCPVANPPLAGTDAPAGYQNYYLRESAGGSFQALLGSADLAATSVSAARFDLDFAGASPDLRHVVLSTCAALTADAIEIPAGEGCNSASPNLYEWSEAGLSLVNLLPGQSLGTPGAALAAPTGAVSADGSRVYWRDLAGGNLYLREGSTTKQADAAAGGGGVFETASGDGSVAFFTKGGKLWRYDAVGGGATELSGGVTGVLGASLDGSRVYYLTAAGLFLRHGGETREVAAAADASNYPPATGTARVSADGTRLAFVSRDALATTDGDSFDNVDQVSGEPDSQVYLYDATAERLDCVSCNPSNARPIGSSTLPGAYANGSAPAYKPRALSADGRRLFFDSADALVLADTNKRPDAYEWEAQGEGSCGRVGGCLALISSGKEDGASFVDASADGADAYFLTGRSLVVSDPGSIDLYDARVGGGFPQPPTPIPCEGDACQVLPGEPQDPALTSLIPGPGNPPLRYTYRHRPKKHKPHPKKHRRHKHHEKKSQRGSRR